MTCSLYLAGILLGNDGLEVLDFNDIVGKTAKEEKVEDLRNWISLYKVW
jgi:hypothetical protein